MGNAEGGHCRPNAARITPNTESSLPQKKVVPTQWESEGSLLFYHCAMVVPSDSSAYATHVPLFSMDIMVVDCQTAVGPSPVVCPQLQYPDFLPAVRPDLPKHPFKPLQPISRTSNKQQATPCLTLFAHLVGDKGCTANDFDDLKVSIMFDSE
jgi:hypothetical protein